MGWNMNFQSQMQGLFVSPLPMDKTKCYLRRHDIIFPMFEFKNAGDINDPKKIEYKPCEYLRASSNGKNI